MSRAPGPNRPSAIRPKTAFRAQRSRLAAVNRENFLVAKFADSESVLRAFSRRRRLTMDVDVASIALSVSARKHCGAGTSCILPDRRRRCLRHLPASSCVIIGSR